MIENVFKDIRLQKINKGEFYNDDNDGFKVISNKVNFFKSVVVVRNIDSQKEYTIVEYFGGLIRKYKDTEALT